jgi:hypothetical protein
MVIEALISLTGASGNSINTNWKPGDPVTIVYDSNKTGSYTLRVEEKDDSGASYTDTAPLNIVNGYNYTINLTLGGHVNIEIDSTNTNRSPVVYPNYILEVSYTSPGSDGQWFTEDDIATEYQIYFNNNQDNILYSTGSDHIPLTADDTIEGYWTNIGGIGGEWCDGSGYIDHSSRWDVKPERVFSNQGTDGIWMTGDDMQSGYYQDTYDAYGDITNRIRYSGKGLDNTWQTADDIPGQDWYGIYWKADYEGDKQGIYWAWTHFYSYDSVGADEKPNTADDHMRDFRIHEFTDGTKFYTWEYIYNAGPDGIAFTSDDQLTGYKVAIKYDSFPTHLVSPGDSANVDPANIGDLDVPGVPYGSFILTNSLVFGFSQIGTSQEDPQVFTLCPDVNMRAWQKWDIYGTNSSDYNQAYIDKCRNSNILFMAGGTMSVVFRDEAADETQFQDWATRNAQGNLQEHPELWIGYRGSMANPAFRAHVLEYLKKQIDLGVDGLFLDELDGGYYNNEGYDDYFIRDFNRYLMNKYPGYTRSDWMQKFGMPANNIIRRDIPYSDLSGNFNYRKYLEQKGWNGNPKTAANPLASEWGYPLGNRFDIHDTSFTGKYMGLYIKEIMVALRKYARDKYSKEILITANGIFPWMDFNSLGMYDGNHDDTSMGEADYVPVQSGHLNGSKSLKTIYLKMLAKSRDVSGNVPLVLFMDWPNSMINGYYNLPLAEKKDFWRIYAAEAYSCGLRFAFHLRSSMPAEPTASDSGILSFLADYSRFYQQNAGLYRNATNMGISVLTGDKINIACNLAYQQDKNRYILHLVNHNYNNQILPQSSFTVSLNLDRSPSKITLISPDTSITQNLSFTKSGNLLQINVDNIDFYDVLIIE